MGDIVNLNKYRKVRQKADRRQLVAVNRQKFARPKADLLKLEADRRSAAKALDGHALEGNGLDGHALKGATHADRRQPPRTIGRPAHQDPSASGRSFLEGPRGSGGNIVRSTDVGP